MIRGFADIHNHQFANLGFGGNAFWGEPSGPVDQALAWCTPVHGPGGTGDFIGNVIKTMYGSSFLGHHVGGYPAFDGWPRWDSVTHQSVHVDWLRRAVDGGLRLMVMLAVNNEYLAGHSRMKQGRTADDMEAVDLQLQGAKDLEAAIDAASGGPGQGWYRIVYSPAEARAVMEAGKLAVVLGIEVDYLFGCRADDELTEDQLRAAVDKYYALGVRHVFPIHFGDNGYGGAAFQNGLERDADGGNFTAINPASTVLDVYTIHTEDASSSGYEYRTARRNRSGLTGLGKTLIRELIAHGMVIDIDHMSARSKADTLDICEAAGYPVVAGHVGFTEISHKDKSHEGQLMPSEVERIRATGGMLGVILHQGTLDEIDTWRGPGQPVVEHVSGNTTNTVVQAYLYAVAKMNGAPVAFGTDYNGFAGLPGPRYGPDSAQVGHNGATPSGRLSYPFTAEATGATLDASVIGQKRYDVSVDGPAHVGMLPDVIAEFSAMGLTASDLDPLLSSAAGYADMWDKAWAVAQPNKRVPDGSLLQDDSGAIYVVEGGARFLVPDMVTFDRLYQAADVRRVSPSVTGSLPTFPADGTLLREANGSIHVIEGTARFHVPDPATFEALFHWEDVRQLWDHALDGLALIPWDGTLLLEAGGAVHVVYGGARFHVPDPATFDALFRWPDVRRVWDHAVDQIPLVPRDGTLLREANGAIHVVHGGARFHVPDMVTFNSLFKADDVRQVWDHAVDQIPLIPQDGNAFVLGRGGPVWTISGGQRYRAPAGQLTPSIPLWPGALDQVPEGPTFSPELPLRPVRPFLQPM